MPLAFFSFKYISNLGETVLIFWQLQTGLHEQLCWEGSLRAGKLYLAEDDKRVLQSQSAVLAQQV